jgi:hypothetical protein
MPVVPLVGGPRDGRTIEIPDHVSVVEMAEDPDMAYHRTHRLVSGSEDPYWFIRGLAEPQYETIFEWHERDWVSPAVAAIRAAVYEGVERTATGRDFDEALDRLLVEPVERAVSVDPLRGALRLAVRALEQHTDDIWIDAEVLPQVRAALKAPTDVLDEARLVRALTDSGVWAALPLSPDASIEDIAKAIAKSYRDAPPDAANDAARTPLEPSS